MRYLCTCVRVTFCGEKVTLVYGLSILLEHSGDYVYGIPWKALILSSRQVPVPLSEVRLPVLEFLC